MWQIDKNLEQLMVNLAKELWNKGELHKNRLFEEYNCGYLFEDYKEPDKSKRKDADIEKMVRTCISNAYENAYDGGARDKFTTKYGERTGDKDLLVAWYVTEYIMDHIDWLSKLLYGKYNSNFNHQCPEYLDNF